VEPDLLAGRLAVDVRGDPVAAVAQGTHARLSIRLMYCCPQDVVEFWVLGCLLVGWLLLIGGARAAGAALLGSAAGALLAACFGAEPGA